MKNIWAIFKRDINKVSRNPVAMIILIGIIFIPSLYAWFNIAANWDPYSNTKNLKIAVGNSDTGTVVDGVSINIGEKIVDALKDNDGFNWVFITEDETIDGVKSGEYYAGIVIPANFSEDMTSILNGEIKKPVFDYYLNEKTNAIANKITDTGMEMIQEQINQTFVQVISKVIAESLGLSAEAFANQDPIDSLIKTFNDMSVSLDTIGNTSVAFKNAALSLQEMVKAVNLALPDAETLIGDGYKTATDMQDLIRQVEKASGQVTEAISELIGHLEKTAQSTDSQLKKIFALIATDANQAADLLEGLAEPANTVIDVANKLVSVLNQLAIAFPDDAEKFNVLIAHLNQVILDERELIKNIEEAATIIRTTGSLPQEKQDEIIAANQRVIDEASTALTLFNGELAPSINLVLNDTYETLGDMSNLMAVTGTSLSSVSQALTSTGNAMGYSAQALGNTESLVKTAKDKIEKINTNLKSVKADDRWGTLMNLLRVDPDTSSSFISAPVGMNTVALYPVANYGAAMTPFYTILCLWVGGLVLVAIIDVEVKRPREFNNLKPWQAYFGRYMIFLVCAILQAIVVAVGNIFFLKVVVVEPVLFFVMSIMAAITFSFFIYTLTVAFDEVGKAIAVIIMVIQVAGAGGTYPIQLLPEFFQALNPYMAFTYGVNGLREAVCGAYANAFWVDLSKMMLYIPVSLLIGLVLRNPLIRMNQYFKRKLEDTELL